MQQTGGRRWCDVLSIARRLRLDKFPCCLDFWLQHKWKVAAVVHAVLMLGFAVVSGLFAFTTLREPDLFGIIHAFGESD
jgi:hypothetical protein